MRLFIRGAYPTRAKIRPPHVWLHASVVATPHNVERLKRLRLPQGLPSGSSKPDFFATTPRIVGNLWQSATFSVEPPSSTQLSFSCSTAETGMLASVAVDRASARTMFIMICSYAACSQFAVPVGMCEQCQSTEKWDGRL